MPAEWIGPQPTFPEFKNRVETAYPECRFREVYKQGAGTLVDIRRIRNGQVIARGVSFILEDSLPLTANRATSWCVSLRIEPSMVGIDTTHWRG